MQWIIDNNTLVKRFTGSSFSDIVLKLTALAVVADAMNHHPDFKVEHYKEILFYLSTHETQSVTEKDYALADQIDIIFNN